MTVYIARIEWDTNDFQEVHSDRGAALASLTDALMEAAELRLTGAPIDLDGLIGVANDHGWSLSLQPVEVIEPEWLAAIYVPPVDNGDDGDPEPAKIQCPHCQGVDVVQVDKAERWNPYIEDEYSTGTLTFSTGGDSQFDTDHYLCTNCNNKLLEPKAFHNPGFDVDYW